MKSGGDTVAESIPASENRRQQIINAATTLFLAKGYNQTTTRDIAKVLNISQPALYHHFGDKETLFVEVVKTVGDQVNHDMKKILAKTYTEPIDQLIDLTDAILTRHPRDVFTLIHSSFTSLSDKHQRVLGMIFGQDYVAPIAQFFATITLRSSIDARTASSFYITSLAPLFGDFHALDAKQTKHERIAQLMDLILYGVAKNN